jgi:hypothetical protein
MRRTQQRVSAVIPANKQWVPLVQGMAENGARVFGLDAGKGLRLAMAMEEILLHFDQTLPNRDVDICVQQGACSVQAVFSVDSEALDLSAMNCVAGSGMEAAPVDDLPLILASRMSDGLSVSRSGSRVRLVLWQDHVYEKIAPGAPRFLAGGKSVDPCSRIRIESTLDYHLIAQGCAGILGISNTADLPFWMMFPGRIVDRASAGELEVCLALDDAGSVRGMLVWEKVSDKSVSFSGPWLLDSCGETIDPMLEHMLSALARSRIVCLFSDPDATPAGLDLSSHGFELLANLEKGGGKQPHFRPVWFRHLREDDGLQVWAHPSCIPFLETVYENVCLIRSIQAVKRTKFRIRDRSLFAATLNREKKQAVLRPLLDGWDNVENIARHQRILHAEGYEHILFRIDLAEGWQAALCGDLVEQGCKPSLVMPLAGESDLLFLEYVPTPS